MSRPLVWIECHPRDEGVARRLAESLDPYCDVDLPKGWYTRSRHPTPKVTVLLLSPEFLTLHHDEWWPEYLHFAAEAGLTILPVVLRPVSRTRLYLPRPLRLWKEGTPLGLDAPIQEEIGRLVDTVVRQALESRSAHFRGDYENQLGGGAESLEGLELPSGSDFGEGLTVPSKQADPAFHFRLEGDRERVCQDQLLAGAEFVLAFHFDTPTPETLAWLEGSKLDEILSQPRVEMGVFVMPPPGFEFREGSGPYRTVDFEKAQLSEPARFQLRAPQQPEGPADFQISLYADRSRIYDFRVPVRVVESVQPDPAFRAPVLDLDAGTVRQRRSQRADVVLRIEEANNQWRVALFDLSRRRGGGYPPVEARHSATRLADMLQKLELAAVARHVIWNQLSSELEPPTGDSQKKAFRECVELVMQSGYRVWDSLRSDPGLCRVLDWLEEFPEGTVLNIETNAAFLPWEILYPIQHQKSWPDEVKQQQDSYHPERLWGSKFQISVELLPLEGPDDRPGEGLQPGSLRIDLALDSRIDGEREWDRFKPVAFQQDYAHTLGEAARQFTAPQAIQQLLLEVDNSATLIYLYCHGRGSEAFQRHSALLEFGRELQVTPDFLTDTAFLHWPVIVVNSCSAGAVSPLSYGGFLEKFRRKRAFGLLGSSFPVPTLFAAAFGKRLLERYVAGDPIGQALYEERRSLLLERCNPLGLFYALHCPPDVRAPRGERDE